MDFLVGFPFPGDSSITLLAVIDDRTLRHFHTESNDDEQHRTLQEAGKMLREDTEKLLAVELQHLVAGGREGSSEIRSGNPADEIIELAKELQTDLIMVGSHGHGGLGDVLLGHVPDRLLQHAPCSVLVARAASDQSVVSPAAEETGMPWHVLLAYDSSAPAQQALDLCAALPFDSKAEISSCQRHADADRLPPGYPAADERSLAAKEARCTGRPGSGSQQIERVHAECPGTTA